jgi:hypothetical protein
MQTIAEKVFLLLPDLMPHLLTYLEKRKTNHEVDSNDETEQLSNLLTGRLVFLLRYMDERGNARYPEGYGRVISGYVDVSETRPDASYSPRAEDGWKKASQYACLYLSALGLVKQFGGIGYEVDISDLGKKVIRSDYIRKNFGSAFEQEIPY